MGWKLYSPMTVRPPTRYPTSYHPPFSRVTPSGVKTEEQRLWSSMLQAEASRRSLAQTSYSARVITTDKPLTPTAEHLADCRMHKVETKTKNLSLLRDLLSRETGLTWGSSSLQSLPPADLPSPIQLLCCHLSQTELNSEVELTPLAPSQQTC